MNPPAPRAALAVLVVLLCGMLVSAQPNATCADGCICFTGSPAICHLDLAKNPPKGAVMFDGAQPFCTAIEFEMLNAGNKRCNIPHIAVMDCVRQKLAVKQCEFSPALGNTKCKCPIDAAAKKSFCQHLAMLNTTHYGNYVPKSVFNMFKCPRPVSGTLLSGSGAVHSSTFECNGFADQVTTIAKPIIDRNWDRARAAIPSPLTIGGTHSTFGPIDIGLFYLSGDLGLDQGIVGLNLLSTPTLTVTSVPRCSDLGAIEAKLRLSSRAENIVVRGTASLSLSNWMGTIRLGPTVTVRTRTVPVVITATASAGIRVENGRVVAHYAVPSIDSVEVTLENVDVNLTYSDNAILKALTYVFSTILTWVTRAVVNLVDPVRNAINTSLRSAMNNHVIGFLRGGPIPIA